MGVRTRSATTSPVKARGPPAPLMDEPLKIFILPRDTSSDARFLLLDHPGDCAKRRFFFCARKGLYGLTKIAAPPFEPRSVLFAAQEVSRDCPEPVNGPVSMEADGYVNKAAEFYVAAPFDLAFLLIPLLAKATSKNLFQPQDDILEEHLNDLHLRFIFQKGRSHMEAAMERICDSIEAGEKMYRFSEDRLFKTILQRAERAIAKTLPASLENKFVTRNLERPLSSIKRDSDSFDPPKNQIFTSSTETLVEEVSPEICHLQRLRTAFNFITSSYLPIDTAQSLGKLLDSKDFNALDEYLEIMESSRKEALVSQSTSDFSRKRGHEDEEAEIGAEKKAKIEEEKRKKAGQSRGVKQLSKVNVSGMQKMSAFFAKKVIVKS